MEITDRQLQDRLLQALATPWTQEILTSTLQHAATVDDLSRQHNIPLATAYRRVHELLDAGLLVVQGGGITEEGKRFELYRAAVRELIFRLQPSSMVVELVPNEDAAAKLYRFWNSLRGVR